LNNTTQDQVILVNEYDQELGLMEKHEAHRKGLLHRAFSAFVFNSKGELLLQRRAFGKYHSEGLWTNTCCSHPISGESIIDAGKRRLSEEMGFETDLTPSFNFIYKAELDNGFTEFELDHVLIGISDETPHLNTAEAMSFKWASLTTIKEDIVKNPSQFTVWFRIIMDEHYEELKSSITHESM
jgi:isopentenyl-diphosphate delta-isomerase